MVVYSRLERRDKNQFKEKVRRTLFWSLTLDVALLVVLQPFRPVLVVGRSMFPTFQNYQIVIAKPVDHEIRRGEVVVANWDDEQILKRVAGVAYDTNLPGLPRPSRVPLDHVYLLGDNAKVSFDSRYFGPVPNHDVKMVVVFPDTSGI